MASTGGRSCAPGAAAVNLLSRAEARQEQSRKGGRGRRRGPAAVSWRHERAPPRPCRGARDPGRCAACRACTVALGDARREKGVEGKCMRAGEVRAAETRGPARHAAPASSRPQRRATTGGGADGRRRLGAGVAGGLARCGWRHAFQRVGSRGAPVGAQCAPSDSGRHPEAMEAVGSCPSGLPHAARGPACGWAGGAGAPHACRTATERRWRSRGARSGSPHSVVHMHIEGSSHATHCPCPLT
jgi:hypothetical protein